MHAHRAGKEKSEAILEWTEALTSTQFKYR